MPYRYEDLDEKRFQKLCQALLAQVFPNLQCLPVSQRDGGRDAVTRTPGEPRERLVFQVKWTPDPRIHGDPVEWIHKTIRAEASNIRRLAREGAKSYLLITNIPTTAYPESGRLDRLDKKLDELTKEYDIPMSCWWRDDLDTRMDLAPDELKWTYSEALVGPDALKALIGGLARKHDTSRQDRLILDVTATQWLEDENVRFRQVGLDHPDLTELFVDIPAQESLLSGYVNNNYSRSKRKIQGAAKEFLSRREPRIVLLGAPGQGKSTLIQFLCQAYRALLLGKTEFLEKLPLELNPEQGRIAFRVDLRDYALWLEGYDPFTDEPMPKRRPRGAQDSVEVFLAHMVRVKSGGSKATAEDIKDIFDRYPCFLAFDGLDEVANERTRTKVVQQIEKALTRLERLKAKPVSIVTARPSFMKLAEPDRVRFAYYELLPLDEPLRIEYLRKWARSQGLTGRERHDLERIFRERSGVPHVRELATNPMQLAILLYLIYRRAESVPTLRTKLYEDYMTLFLDREATKDSAVATHRPLLEEITGYLGWHLQAVAESGNSNGRVSMSQLKKVMRHYLADNEKEPTLVDVLFTAATTRVWAITSRVQGTFEFDVQPIREFFAARYLALTSPPGGRSGRPDKFQRFMELAARPYWFNTARFMAGFFTSGELGTLADELDVLLDRPDKRFWSRRVVRTLIDDGIFDERPRALKKAVERAHDSLGARLLLHDLVETQTEEPLREERGGTTLIGLLKGRLAEAPTKPISLELGRLLAKHAKPRSLVDWWAGVLADLENREIKHWLTIGAALNVLSALNQDQIEQLGAGDEEAIALLLAGGATPARGSNIELSMLAGVLSGRNTEIGVSGTSLPADIARVLHPVRFLVKNTGSRFIPESDLLTIDQFSISTSPIESSTARIRKAAPEWRSVLGAIRESAGQKVQLLHGVT